MLRRIKGIYVSDSGTQDGRGTLALEIDSAGMHDPEVGPIMPVRCEQWGADCPILTNGCWQFWPDDSELARLGIVPTQMIASAAP